MNLNNSESLCGVSLLCVILREHLNFQVVGNVVPAAAVTPQPLVYTIIVAVKRLVVGLNTLLQTTL